MLSWSTVHRNRNVGDPGNVNLVADLDLVEHRRIDDTSAVFKSVRTSEADRRCALVECGYGRGHPGYTEIYGFARSTLGWNQLSGTKAFSIGPLTNIEFAFGADANTDNTTLGSAKRSIQAGLQYDFETPYRGFLNVAAYAYKEWQHDGFASTFPFQPIPNPSGNVNFDPTWAVEINYSQPLGFLPPWLPLKYKALLVMHGPKGCGEPCQPLGPGLLRTTEYLTQQILVFDVGQALWNLPQRWAIFGGYRWWKNKFGISPDQPNGYFVGTTESTWLFGTAMKF